MIIDGEALVGAYLREHADIEALGARVAGTTPGNQVAPWIRLTQLDAADVTPSRVEHLIAYLFQLDCYAGQDATRDHAGQAEAWLLARTARAALKAMPAAEHQGVVVARVIFTSMARIPDQGFEPARERVILDAEVRLHGVPG